jgi:hypothetical protein
MLFKLTFFDQSEKVKPNFSRPLNMYSTQDALRDENMDPNQISQNVDIGRQYKRLRIASDLSKHIETENVDVATVGARAVGLVNLSIQSLTGNLNPNQAGLVAIIQAAVANAFNQACGPDGAVTDVINQALQRSERNLTARL